MVSQPAKPSRMVLAQALKLEQGTQLPVGPYPEPFQKVPRCLKELKLGGAGSKAATLRQGGE